MDATAVLPPVLLQLAPLLLLWLAEWSTEGRSATEE